MTSKLLINQFRWLAATLLLVAAMAMPTTAWAQESTVTFTAKEGTAGFNNESFDKLIDGKYTSEDGTKWCLSFSSDKGAYIIFSASEPIDVIGYSIVTGNDNASETGRNPKSWALYGCNDASAERDSQSWVLIDEVTNDTTLKDVNYQKFDFTLSNPPSVEYQYFKMEISATKGASVMQMSELILTYSTCKHQWVKTDEVIAPTCTERGYDVYKCSLCNITMNVANDNDALGHDWVDGTVIPPTCTTDGYTPQTCSRCHAERKINIVTTTGHQWGTDDVCDVCHIKNTVLSKPQGDGTLDNPYRISTVGELYWFAGLVNGDASVCDYNKTDKPTGTKQNTAACGVLISDITVNSDLQANLNDDGTVKDGYSVVKWTPIGNSKNIFIGNFDGKGHAFSGLYFNDTNISYVGLFGFNNGTIKNVGVVDSYFEGNEYVGGVCGYNSTDMNFETPITITTVTNCYNTGAVSGNNSVGGVCGYNGVSTYAVTASATITNCYNTGSVSGNNSVGGVCGYNYAYAYANPTTATITNCYNTGSVSGHNSVGGVCGYNTAYGEHTGPSSTITNCYNTGSVSGNDSVGGVCGYNEAYAYGAPSTATITNCYNTGSVGGNNSVGGVCGYNTAIAVYAEATTIITNCYNTGALSGNNSVGGVCGYNTATANMAEATTSITNCYFCSTTYSGDAVGKNDYGTFTDVMGKTTAQFESGEVCYLLNGSSPYGTWGQQLGTDSSPMLGSPYQLISTTLKTEDGTYWTTFSDLDSDVTLSVPADRMLKVYNATVSAGTMTLTRRTDSQVAMGEGVLLTTDDEYVNVKANESNELQKVDYINNNLVATQATAQTIAAEEGYRLYDLTYNGADTDVQLGFYLGVATVDDTEYTDGSYLNVTPGKAYLKVTTEAATDPGTSALVRGFALPADEGGTTGIECITITGNNMHINSKAEGIFDMLGRRLNSEPTHGIYIKNGVKCVK